MDTPLRVHADRTVGLERATDARMGTLVLRRFTPFGDWIDDVPGVILVVPKPAVDVDAGADTWEPRAAHHPPDFGSSQRSAGVRQPDSPACAITADADYTTHDSDVPRWVHTPRPSTETNCCVQEEWLYCTTSHTVEQAAIGGSSAHTSTDSDDANRDGTNPRSHAVTFPTHGGSGSQANRYNTMVVRTINE